MQSEVSSNSSGAVPSGAVESHLRRADNQGRGSGRDSWRPGVTGMRFVLGGNFGGNFGVTHMSWYQRVNAETSPLEPYCILDAAEHARRSLKSEPDHTVSDSEESDSDSNV